MFPEETEVEQETERVIPPQPGLQLFPGRLVVPHGCSFLRSLSESFLASLPRKRGEFVTPPDCAGGSPGKIHHESHGSADTAVLAAPPEMDRDQQPHRHRDRDAMQDVEPQ